jgi:hypothetical protein
MRKKMREALLKSLLEEREKVKEQLDQLPPELRPMRMGFAALLSVMGVPGAEEELSRIAYVEVNAQLRRKSIKRVK